MTDTPPTHRTAINTVAGRALRDRLAPSMGPERIALQRAIRAIEDEAAQAPGAAPLSAGQLFDPSDDPDDTIICHEGPCEGTAPRAEGPLGAALERLLSVAMTEEEDVSAATQDEWIAAIEQANEALAAPSAPQALDVERLARVLAAIHGDNVPFPRGVPTPPREYAELIVDIDARIEAEYARLSGRPHDPATPGEEDPA